jgi:hypothetical protein
VSPLTRLNVDAIEVGAGGFYAVIGGHRWRMVHKPDSVRLICDRSVVDLLESGAVRYAGRDLRAGAALRVLMRNLEGET